MSPALQTSSFAEKAPLERYVPPAKPSLVGLSRAALAEALGGIRVPPAATYLFDRDSGDRLRA